MPHTVTWHLCKSRRPRRERHHALRLGPLFYHAAAVSAAIQAHESLTLENAAASLARSLLVSPSPLSHSLIGMSDGAVSAPCPRGSYVVRL